MVSYLHLAENFPPNISANKVFRVNTHSESVYSLTVIDPGDNITLSLRHHPRNSNLKAAGDNEYMFYWNLSEPTTEPLVFIATDMSGASTSFVPTVEVCACVNSGNCTLDGVITSNSTVILNCQCPQGKFS